ncbi:unnamed protein product [Cuscuta campestris]|uniref:Tf2-1-like SH3-like domain-containing protein n=1 Tax=Cuscuta campestris TaxID=132261 RepID=A0A484LBL5_9ASTE|nr:unnamed protein product [Cuscuta campestris]
MFQGELAAAQETLKKEVELVMKQIKEITNSVEIPMFEGRNDPEKFSKWLAKVEDVFTLKDVPEDKKVKLVAAKFQIHASTWWASVASKRKLQGKAKPSSQTTETMQPTSPKNVWDKYDDEDYDPIWDEECVKEDEEVFADAEDNPFWVIKIKEEEQEKKTHEGVVTPDAETSARDLSLLTVLRTKRVEFLQASYEKKVEKGHNSKWSIQPDDLVWVHVHKARLFNKRKSKLQPQDDGPFEVLAKVHKNSYLVNLTRGQEVAATFHRRDLSPYEDFEDLPSLRTNSFEDWEDVIPEPGPIIPSPMSYTLAKIRGLKFKHYDPF